MTKVSVISSASLFFLSLTVLFTDTSFAQTKSSGPSVHPAWSGQSNIYEVNVRQYTPEGTFKAFEKSLPRLKKMGVQILWFMPITPIGIEGRKADTTQLGSYYSVRDYKAINPEFGTMKDWKHLVNLAHSMGFKVITDWVANHSSPDNVWVTRHPDFYARDSAGNIVIPFDWTDTRKLNYNNRELRDSMIEAMEWWVKQSNIDGFRCDYAEGPPADFWRECIDSLKKIKHVFMLAEGDKPYLHKAGFDETYAWNIMWATVDVAQGKKSLAYLDSVLNNNFESYPTNAYKLYFTTDHDENSWNGTEFEKYGNAYKAFAVFTQTMYESVPLVYSGQESANKKRLKFFTKDSIDWDNYTLAPFYSTLLHLRKEDPALAADAAYKKIATGNDVAIFAYARTKGSHKVITILNLSNEPQRFTIDDKIINGSPLNIFLGIKEKLSINHVFSMEPWGYIVYEY